MKIQQDFDFSKISWFKTGGKVDSFVLIESIDEVRQLIQRYGVESCRFIGNASNILLSDAGFRGCFVKLNKNLNQVDLVSEHSVKATASCLLSEVADFAMKNGYSNLEFFATIPGSVGGGVFMNAGCFNSEIKDVLEEITALNTDTFEILVIKRSDIDFTYRSSSLPLNLLILDATFNVIKAEQGIVKDRMLEMSRKRTLAQPLAVKTCGSTFKNPKEMPAWKVIEDIGLRGFKIGGASFSTKHANFIINEGGASSMDIFSLIELAQNKAKQQLGITLESEIQLIGDFSSTKS